MPSPTTQTNTVADLLAHGETDRLECKSAKGGFPKSFWESYSAFANMDGGTIVLGVSEPKKGIRVVEGVKRPDVLAKTLWDTVNNPDKVSANVLFPRHVRVEDAGGKKVLVVEVPRADRVDRPVYVGRDVFRGTYRRNGEGDYRCPRESVLAMLRDQNREPSDGAVAEELSVADLDAESVRRYHTLFSNLKPDHVWTRLPDEELLAKIGAAVRGRDGVVRPTVAGLVCFGDFVTILRVLPDFFLDYRERLSGDTRWTDRVCSSDGTWSGNVFDFFFRVHPRLTADLKVPFAMRDAVTRIDDTPAHKALREALANALVHADYRGRCGIVVEKAFRRISISNPGTFRIPKSVAISGGTSDARNANLFNIFSLVDIGERSGSGLCNLFDVWNRNGFPPPEVEESFEPDRIRLSVSTGPTVEKSKEKNSSTVEKTGPTTEKTDITVEKTVEKKDGTVEKAQSLILGHLKVFPQATQEELQQITGLTRRGVEWNLKTMKLDGRLRRVGPDKGGHWEVLSPPSPPAKP